MNGLRPSGSQVTAVALAGLALGSAARAGAERRALRCGLRDLIGSDKVATAEALRELHQSLHLRIDPHTVDRSSPRPLLRARAIDTLHSGSGLCGENARLAIGLLGVGGVRANRLYLRGERWEHCMVEAHWQGTWVAFDGHDDAKLRMADDQIGRIPSDRLDLFPNAARQNPWRRAVRFKPLFRLGPSRLDRLRPPTVVVRIAESPDLIRAMACAVVSLVAWRLHRRSPR